MIYEEIQLVQNLMDEKKNIREKLYQEWLELDSIRLALHRYQAQHHEFDNKAKMKEAMLHNFNPYDTFSLKKEKNK